MWSKFQNKEELERMLEGKTPEALAAELGISHMTIYRAIHRLGIAETNRRKFSGFGNTHSHWKGGRLKNGHGYILIYTGVGTYKYEHHLVMEKMLGRPLRKGERVHHRNQNRADNRPENLELVMLGKHYGKVECPFCDKSFKIE